MSRWHASSCSNPRIAVQRQRPRCESCNSSPDIDVPFAAQAAKSSPIPFLPPDEPPGEMRLWWPPCVPYVTTGPDGHPVAVQPPQDDLTTSSSHEGKSPEDPDRFHMYLKRLKKDEFRVLCLAPVDDADAPVHVSLEVYNDRYHPEYETVSYTWGGETGDSSLCQPVYIGPYWDILLQTHNCWEMLRYLRPWRGVRTAWVDAICINQADIRERQEQVAKIGRIYEKASRVVIYLGPDLVPPTSTSSRHPRRHHLQEFDTLAEKPQIPSNSLIFPRQLKLSDVLSREYFRRVWIIQELILSRNITLRIGDTEFIVDHTISSQAFQACNAPWFAFVTQKLIGDPSGNSLRAAVELAGPSRASDPRDKIFGVLGLIDPSEHHISAAYSISVRHLVIGYFAYCLLAKKDIRVIFHASSLRSSEGMPSWAPAAGFDASRSELLIPVTGNLQMDWLCFSDGFEEAYSRHHGCVNPKTGFSRVAKSQGLNQHTCFKLACAYIPYVSDSANKKPPISTGESKTSSDKWSLKTCWHSKTAIDSSTGAISLTAMHILSLGNLSEAKVERIGKIHVHILKFGTSTLYIYANECILGPADEPGKIHLFALCDNRTFKTIDDPDGKFNGPGAFKTKSRFCILQQVNDEDRFRLLSASVNACFHIPRKIDSVTSFKNYRLGSNITAAYDDRLAFNLPLVRVDGRTYMDVKNNLLSPGPDLEIGHLHMPISHRIDELREDWLGVHGGLKSHKGTFFPYVGDFVRYPSPRFAFPRINENIILEVFQSILDAERGGSSVKFFDTYFQAVREFNPQLIRWENRPRNTAVSSPEEVGAIDLVQLRFDPDQYDVLEDILDSIKEYVKRGIKHEVYREPSETSPVDGSHGHFHPPFLRIGWQDLGLIQLNQTTQTMGLKREEIDGLHVLDLINEVIDKERQKDPKNFDRSSWVFNDSVVREHRGQTIWVAFDLLSLTMWAQTHPLMAKLRELSCLCKEGENEVNRLLRPSTEEEKEIRGSLWPHVIMECFKIDGEFRSITIV